MYSVKTEGLAPLSPWNIISPSSVAFEIVKSPVELAINVLV